MRRFLFFLYHHDGAKRHWLRLPGDFTIAIEFGYVPKSAWVKIEWGEGYKEGIGVTAGFGYGVWLTLKLPWKVMRRIPGFPHDKEREVGFSYYSGEARLQFGHDPIGSPVYNHCLKIWDWRWIVGKPKHSHRVLATVPDQTLMVGWWSGDSYNVDIILEERVWKDRVRYRRHVYYTMDVPPGGTAPPIPGKGENSWDCGDDAIFGMSVDTMNVEGGLPAALLHFAERVEQSRLRYANRSWIPDKRRREQEEAVHYELGSA